MMRKRTKEMYKVLCAVGAAMLCMTGCTIGKKADLVLDKQEVTIETGDSSTLHIVNENQSQLYMTWSSSNEKVAKVDNGKVQGLEEGKATISGCTKDGRKVECEVTVEDPEVKNIILNPTNLTLKAKKTATIEATVNPEMDDPQLSWSTSDAEVAVVDSDGTVTAKKAGTATITVQALSGKQAKCTVTVKGTKKKVQAAANGNGGTTTKVIYLTPQQIVDRYPGDFVFPQSSEMYLSDDDVDSLNASETQQAINEIYAREGHIFHKTYWKNFFGKYSWYTPYRKVSNSDFTDVEYANVQKLIAHRGY